MKIPKKLVTCEIAIEQSDNGQEIVAFLYSKSDCRDFENGRCMFNNYNIPCKTIAYTLKEK